MFDIFPSNMGPHLRYLKLERELYDVTKQRMEEPVASVAGAQPVASVGAQLRASVRDNRDQVDGFMGKSHYNGWLRDFLYDPYDITGWCMIARCSMVLEYSPTQRLIFGV